ncbi:DUF6804 family protein [Halomonas mongoliensis]|uniref:DUF6804 family protein n=1 Tax=Halomonas mongoliensis TaxID=321265 RepID=UPI00403AA90C
MPLAAIYIAVGLLILGVLPLPYGYYILLRIVATAAFAWAAVTAHQNGERTWPWIFSLAAVLYNPILPVFLPKEAWIVINMGSAAALFINRKKIVK